MKIKEIIMKKSLVGLAAFAAVSAFAVTSTRRIDEPEGKFGGLRIDGNPTDGGGYPAPEVAIGSGVLAEKEAADGNTTSQPAAQMQQAAGIVAQADGNDPAAAKLEAAPADADAAAEAQQA